MIAVLQHSHAVVCGIGKIHLRYFQQRTVKMTCIGTNGVLPCRKANTTAIGAIIAHKITCEVRLLDQAQTHHASHTVAWALQKCVPASIRMPFAAATVTIGKKTNKNNHHRADCFFDGKTSRVRTMCDVCVVCGVS